MCIRDRCEAVLRRGVASAPDFLAIDGGEGGSGAAPQALADHVSVSYTHLRAHETVLDLVCRLLLEKKNKKNSCILYNRVIESHSK